MPNQLSHDDYTVGWISALPLELAAARAVLDETHEPLPSKEGDYNVYAYGRIFEHNVVIACLPAGLIGTNSAASVAMQMHRSFSRLRFGLMVGIGGGVPSKEHDIRLGDVVVAQPGNGYGGVVQYDFGKSRPDGFERTGFLNSPPVPLLSALSMLRASQDAGGVASGILNAELITTASRPPSDADVLYYANTDDAAARVVDRSPRPSPGVYVHYGTIASGNQVMRHALERDKVSRELGGVLCFEMEAAGLMNSFPCLVIRGICDYSDAHKTKNWQPFAAAAAAVYTKQLLAVLPRGALLNDKNLPDDRIVSLPFQRNHKFVGRQDVLRELERRLFLDEECQEIALFGLGGIGKTQIVLQFASMVSETRPDMTIFWIVALSQATIEKSFLEIAGQLKLGLLSGSKEDTKEVVKRHLEHSYSRRWLMVIDNVDDESPVDILLGCVPHGRSGYKLYTSRNTRVVQDLAGGDAIEVPRLGEEEALRLMTKSLLKYNSGQHEPDIRALCEELEFLPLALTQAAAYMNQTLTIPAKYRTLMTGADQDLVQLMSVENRDRTRYQQVGHAVATTWVVSFNQILQSYPMAADMLKFISCVEWRCIPWGMLPKVGSAVDITSAVGTLCAYSFLAPSTRENTYDMHRLVHLAIRIWVNERGDTDALYTSALLYMEDILPAGEEDRDVWRVLLPHATCLLRLCGEADPDTQAALCWSVAECLQYDARYKECIHWLGKSQRLLTGLNAGGTRILEVQKDLAEAYWSDYQDSNAIEILEHVVAEYRANHHDQASDALCSELMLGRMYSEGDRIEEGVLVLERLASIEQCGTVESSETLLGYQSALGAAYLHQGQTQKAIDLLEKVDKLQSHRAETDKDWIITRHQLSLAYLDDPSRERVTKAVQLLEHVDNVTSAILRVDHHTRLSIQRDLAEAYVLDGKPQNAQRAIQLLESVVEIESMTCGSHDTSSLESKRQLVKAYLNLNPKHHASKLVEVLEQIVQIESQTLEEDDPSLFRSRFNLGRAYSWIGDTESITTAAKILEHATEIGSKVLDKDDSTLLLSRFELAQAYVRLAGRDNLARAVSLLEDNTHTKSQILEEHDPYRLCTEHQLAYAYLELNGPDTISRAVELLEHVTKIKSQVLKEDDPSRLVSEELLAEAYSRIGTLSATLKAVELLEHVVSIKSLTLRDDDPSRLSSEHFLAQAYLETGRPRTIHLAIELLEHVVEVQEDTLKVNNTARAMSRDLLEHACEAREKLQQDIDRKRYARGWRPSTIRKFLMPDPRIAQLRRYRRMIVRGQP
ncbi:hypothetical protein PRZ48_008993 [Zasmidium cellare]|uniref:Uncharacterized protein n=1 Tax=Zasmidium cellare TaxID=395010 RepID=A0ABR0EHT5_ZASCE|nr:hypothetical protein PRZ48_008993 [Zasmidium cellare]